MVIEDIKGLGAAAAKKLLEAEISLVEDIATATDQDLVDISEKSGIKVSKLEDWRVKGQSILESKEEDTIPESVEGLVEDKTNEIQTGVEPVKTVEPVASKSNAQVENVIDSNLDDAINEFFADGGEGTVMSKKGHSKRAIVFRIASKVLDNPRTATLHIKDDLSPEQIIRKVISSEK